MALATLDVGEVAHVGEAVADATQGPLLGSSVLETPESQMGVPEKIVVESCDEDTDVEISKGDQVRSFEPSCHPRSRRWLELEAENIRLREELEVLRSSHKVRQVSRARSGRRGRGRSGRPSSKQPPAHPVQRPFGGPTNDPEKKQPEERRTYAAMAAGHKAPTLPRASLMKLSYVPPSLEDGKVVVKPHEGLREKGCKDWEFTLVGHFIGQKLSYLTVNSIARKLWGADGLTDVLSTENGFFFLKFTSEAAVEKIIEGGPWHMVNRPFFLRRWQPNLSLLKQELQKLPLWVKLRGVPLEYWTDEGLSTVASGVGRPLYTDRRTMEKTRIDFARICIEMDASKEPVTEFEIQEMDGHSFTVYVDYDWMPERCITCDCFGHALASCPKRRNVTQPEEKRPSPEEWTEVPLKNKGKTVAATHLESTKKLEGLDKLGMADLPAGRVSTPNNALVPLSMDGVLSIGEPDSSPILSNNLANLAKDSLSKDVTGRPPSRARKKSPNSSGRRKK